MRSGCGSRNLLSNQQPNQLQLHPQPLTHNRETSQIRLPQTFENTEILVMVDHPSYLLQYWGKVTAPFATTKSTEVFRCRRPLVFRNWNDSECDKNPLELNSPGPIHTVRRHQEQNSVTPISQRLQNTRVILKKFE